MALFVDVPIQLSGVDAGQAIAEMADALITRL